MPPGEIEFALLSGSSGTVLLPSDPKGSGSGAARELPVLLSWWTHQLTRWNGKGLVLRNPDVTLQSDASLTGWGATAQGVCTRGPWSLEEKSSHINWL